MTTQIDQSKLKFRFSFVDALRGIAALWVVLYHVKPEENLPQLIQLAPPWIVEIVFKQGSLGVPIFFTLSGFVTAHSLRHAEISLPYFKLFCLRRLIRLNPPYYVSIIIVLGIGLITSWIKQEPYQIMGSLFSMERFLAHLFYLQELFKLTNFNDVYWTLCLEIQFYLLFILLLIFLKKLQPLNDLFPSETISLCVISLITLLYPLNIIHVDTRPVFVLPILYMFLGGVFAYWSTIGRIKSILFYVFIVIVFSSGIAQYSSAYTISAVVAVLLSVALRTNQMHIWLNWGWLQFLGLISYSLYLIHTPILGGFFFVSRKAFTQTPIVEVFTLILAIVACLIFAYGMWKVVEAPTISLGHKLKYVKNMEARQ